ncbi:MAG: M81 family metallopeptidase [Planctomyces sp.]|nr:M81 family metallopeptidase [Planctomyces sp.]
MTPPKRVFVAGLFHETHTFLEGRTQWEDFKVLRGAEMLSVAGDSSPLGGALERAKQYHWNIVPGLMAAAHPSAMVTDQAFSEYWAGFSSAIRTAQQAGPLDGIFLVLHGAMTCESINDVEGELLRRLSVETGGLKLPVFGVYDLHANFSEAMATGSHCLVAYRQNPHADARESSVRAIDLMQKCFTTGQLPRTYLAQPPIVWPPTGTGTAVDPMKSLLEMARSLQVADENVWEVNVNAGFAFADTPDTGVSFCVVTTGTEIAARELLSRLTDRCLELAEVGNTQERPVDEVLSELDPEPKGLTVLVEPSDNIGGGAPGDCTGLLRSMLKYGLRNSAVCLWDPDAVSRLASCSRGDVVELSLGGKGSQLDPGPLLLHVTFSHRFEGLFELADKQSHLASMVGDRFDMGPCAVVQADGITILLTTIRTPPMDLGQWMHAGFDPSRFSYVGVKAAVAHRKAWDPISRGNLWVGTSGPCSSNLREFPFTRIRRPIYPLDSIASSTTQGWFRIQNESEIASPAILVYPDRIEANLRQMIELAGGTDHLRPHVKTHKMPQIIAMKRRLGISKFKTATIAEAEMTATAGGEDVMLAYQPVGPGIHRLIALIQAFPQTRFTALVDDSDNLRQIAAAAELAKVTVRLFVDLNVGMNRTGIAPGNAAELYRQLCRTPGVQPAGLHAYDGHLHNTDMQQLQHSVSQAFQPVWDLREVLRADGLPVPVVVASGTPTFRLLAERGDVEVGCGTTVLWDFGQPAVCPDLRFLNAAVLLTRVISKPASDRLCLDLGHKAVAAEMPQPRVRLFGLEDAAIVLQSEEHLVVQTDRAWRYRVGDVIYGIPRHICPTVALHQSVHVVRDGAVAEQWPVVARARKLTI